MRPQAVKNDQYSEVAWIIINNLTDFMQTTSFIVIATEGFPPGKCLAEVVILTY